MSIYKVTIVLDTPLDPLELGQALYGLVSDLGTPRRLRVHHIDQHAFELAEMAAEAPTVSIRRTSIRRTRPDAPCTGAHSTAAASGHTRLTEEEDRERR